MKLWHSIGEPEALAPGGVTSVTTGKLRALTLPARLIALIVMASPATAATVANFDDIDYWIGSGANRSALVVDWDGTTTTDNSLAWGFRWDTSVKGIDLLSAIATADPRLYVRMGPVSGFGLGVFGIGYDVNNDGEFAAGYDTDDDGELDEFVAFDAAGIALTEPADGSISLDPADWYAEGWFISNFWNYGIATSSPFDGGSWTRAGGGISNRNLVDGSWDSLAFTPINTLNYAQNPLAAESAGSADFDGNGAVDGRDFLAWQRGESPSTLSASDLTLWQTNFGSESPTVLNIAIPEPSTGLLVSFIAALIWYFTLRRSLTHEMAVKFVVSDDPGDKRRARPIRGGSRLLRSR